MGVCRNSRSGNDHVVSSSLLRQGFSVTIMCIFFFFLSPLTAVRKSLRRSWVERRLGEESHSRVVRVAFLFPVRDMEGVATPTFLGGGRGSL